MELCGFFYLLEQSRSTYREAHKDLGKKEGKGRGGGTKECVIRGLLSKIYAFRPD